MNKYKTVFEISDKAFDWWFPAAGLAFVVLGVVLIKVGKARQWKKSQRWVGYYIVGFATFWTLLAFGAMFPDYYQAQKAYRTGNYSVVEGAVEDFRPMPYEGHQDECFSVQGQTFCYSDYAPTPGFNNSASHGGPIRAGLHVRIAYYGNHILRIDVRDGSAANEAQRQISSAKAREDWEERQRRDPVLDKMTLGFSIALLFMTAWCNVSWRRFMKFWLKPPYRPITEVGFRLFFAANLIGAIWYSASQVMWSDRPARAYLDAMGIALAWIVVIVLMVHFVEWQARRRERDHSQNIDRCRPELRN